MSPGPSSGEARVTRGGRPKDRTEPERRCVATGERSSKAPLIRFVIGPGGELVPDLAERLPGRGCWLTASRAAAETALKRRAFARAARAPVEVPPDLPDLLERLLARRLVDAVALARKAGLAVTGFEKVRARLKQGPVGALIQARDGSEQGRGKLRPLADGAPVIDLLDASELGLAFGRDFVIHAALDAGGATDRVLREARRLSGFRPGGAPQGDRTRAPAPPEGGSAGHQGTDPGDGA